MNFRIEILDSYFRGNDGERGGSIGARGEDGLTVGEMAGELL